MATLVVDIGNSSTTLARYAGGRLSQQVQVRGGVREAHERCRQAVRDMAAEGGSFAGAMVASVVPAIDDIWRNLIEREAGVAVEFITAGSRLPMQLDYARPETTGADRLADVAGALARYGAPVLVVDIGTAVTYDLVSADRRFFTGVIGPGPDIMARALSDYTALLPLIAWWEQAAPAIPKDTAGAMRFGIEAAFCGTLRETVQRLCRLSEQPPRLVATGGFAGRFIPPLQLDFIIDPELTLFGIGWLYDYQRSN